MRVLLLFLVAILSPLVGYADYCTEQGDAALIELRSAMGSGANSSGDARAREVLERLCRDAQAAAVDRAVAAEAEKPAARPADEPESTELLGVEFKQAPKGAEGYKRASKSP